MARDWTKTLPNSSFRGSPFFVEEERLDDSGRMVAVHSFVKAEEHDTEDMGRKVRKWSVSAYIVGDNADADALAFVEVCSQSGNGVLVMPVLGTQTVKCTGCKAVSVKDRLGFVKFDLEFIEAGNGSAFVSATIGDRIASNLMDGMAAVVGATLSSFSG